MVDPINRKKKQKKTGNRIALWLAALLVLGIGILGWRLWTGIYIASPQLNYLLLNINGEPEKLISGEKVVLHPKDQIKVVKISTNVPFNIGIRLFCKGFDAQALLFEELGIADLFSEEEIFNNCEFRIQVKHFNKEIGYIQWKVEPYLEDWLEKASRAISLKRRIAILENALRSLPDRREIKIRLAQAYVEAKRWNSAARLLEDLIENRPERDLFDDLLVVYRSAGNRKGVKSVLIRMIKLWPDDPEPRYELAEVLEEQKRWADAIKQYEILINLVPPEDKPHLYDQLGYLYAKKKKYTKAIYWYEKALTINKSDENLYYNLAYLYEKIGKKDKSAFFLEQALKFKTDDMEGRLKLAQGYLEKKNYKKAKSLITEVLKRKPGNMKALLLLVEIEEKLGNKTALKNVYKKILAKEPKNDTVMYNLGVLEYESGNLDQASRLLARYLKMKPRDKDAHGLLFYIYRKAKKQKAAFDEALKLISLTPKDLEPYHFAFQYLKSKKDYDQIIQLMNKGLKANPDALVLREYLVFCYLEKNQEKNAMEQMEKILAQRPKDVKLWLHLARLREKNGLYHKALMAYKHVVELDPGNDEAAEAYLKLRLKGFENEEASGGQ